MVHNSDWWKPLNVNTLRQTESENINPMITICRQSLTDTTYLIKCYSRLGLYESIGLYYVGLVGTHYCSELVFLNFTKRLLNIKVTTFLLKFYEFQLCSKL